MLVGISGKMQSGKDTVGKIWQYLSISNTTKYNLSFQEWLEFGTNNSEWQIKKFATKVKEVASILTGISSENLERDNIKNANLPKCWNTTISIDDEITLTKVMTFREMFQKIGTDAIRNNVHPNAWVNALMADYSKTAVYSKYESRAIIGTDYPNWIITDVRFPNETEAIKDKKGILIRVNRESDVFDEVNIHLSETALDFYTDWDYIIENNGSINDLINKVKEIYNEVTNIQKH